MSKKYDEVGMNKIRFTKKEKALALKQAGIEVPRPINRGGGRPKGRRNRVNWGLDEIIKDNKVPIITKVLEEIEKGNTTLLAKMIDKLLPNLQHNVNETKETFEDWLKKQKEVEVVEEIQDKALKYIEGESNG